MTIHSRAGLLKLKTRIKSLCFERREVKNQIRKLGRANSRIYSALDSDNSEKLNSWMENNNMIASEIRYHSSHDARMHHLAYGLLRGVPYRKMERSNEYTEAGKRFMAEKLLAIVLRYAAYRARKEWTLEKIIAWLE